MRGRKQFPLGSFLFLVVFSLSLFAQSGAKIRTILHLTDVHFDANYKEGSYADCLRYKLVTLPCCHPWEIPVGSRLAAKFGDRNCDAPRELIEESFKWLSNPANLPKPDLIFWTGDDPAHNDISQSRDKNLESIKSCTDFFLKYFPGIQVYPSLGNHDSWPVDNLENPPENNWLLSKVTQFWSPWFPNNTEVNATLSYGGYYTTLVFPGLRIISLNNIYDEKINILSSGDDPAGQKAWFGSVLEKAAQAGEKVWVIGHIFPGESSTHPGYTNNYQALMNKYHHIIVNNFFGHSHTDQLTLFRDNYTNPLPNGVAYIAPSITPYGAINPSARVYFFDDQTFEVVDYYQYHANLTEANLKGEVSFNLSYTAKTFFGLSDLSPASWQGAVNRMKTDNTFLLKYYYLVYHTASEFTPACDQKCQTQLFCSTNFVSGDMQQECIKSGGKVQQLQHTSKIVVS